MVALKGEKSGPPGSGMCCRRLTTSLPCERTRAGGREKQRSQGDVCAKQGGGHAGESRRFGICCNRGRQCPHRLCQIGGMGTAGVMRRRRGQSRSSGFAKVDLQRGLRLRARCGRRRETLERAGLCDPSSHCLGTASSATACPLLSLVGNWRSCRAVFIRCSPRHLRAPALS